MLGIPSRVNVNSVILDESASAAVRHCVEWLSCLVDKKVRMCDYFYMGGIHVTLIHIQHDVKVQIFK